MAAAEFTVSDVYEHASSIGKDIEKIVNEYGKQSIQDIMPKIVYALEQLEGLAEQRQLDKEKINELIIEKKQLVIYSKRDEGVQRELEDKLAYLDALVTDDKKKLEATIGELRQQNAALMDELDRREDELVKLRTQGALPGDVEVMVRLKETVDTQRDQIRLLNSEVHTQRKEIDAIQEHSDHLTRLNENLRQKNFKLHLQNNNRGSTDEVDNAGDLPQQIKSKPNELNLKDELNISNYESNDKNENRLGTNSDEQNELDINAMQNEHEDSVHIQENQEVVAFLKKDPNRPRYTLAEMQTVVEERNIFKIHKLALEEELELLKNGEGNNRLRLAESAPGNLDTRPIPRKQSGVKSLLQKFLGK